MPPEWAGEVYLVGICAARNRKLGQNERPGQAGQGTRWLESSACWLATRGDRDAVGVRGGERIRDSQTSAGPIRDWDRGGKNPLDVGRFMSTTRTDPFPAPFLTF